MAALLPFQVGMRNLAVTLFVTMLIPSVASAQTMREQVRTLGVSEEIVVSDYPSLPLSGLATSAGAVVQISVRSTDTFLSSDGTAILTDYRVTVVDVIKGDGSIAAGDVVTVRRPGGVLNIEGRKVISSENRFPAFAAGSEYVLFLKTDAGQPYQMLAGPQSAYRIYDGSVVAMGELSKIAAVRMPVFVQEVRELLASRPQATAQR
jgi:hypothetical protein